MKEIVVAFMLQTASGQSGAIHALREDWETTLCGRRLRWRHGWARPDQLTCQTCREAVGVVEVAR